MEDNAFEVLSVKRLFAKGSFLVLRTEDAKGCLLVPPEGWLIEDDKVYRKKGESRKRVIYPMIYLPGQAAPIRFKAGQTFKSSVNELEIVLLGDHSAMVSMNGDPNHIVMRYLNLRTWIKEAKPLRLYKGEPEDDQGDYQGLEFLRDM